MRLNKLPFNWILNEKNFQRHLLNCKCDVLRKNEICLKSINKLISRRFLVPFGNRLDVRSQQSVPSRFRGRRNGFDCNFYQLVP